MSDLEVTVEQLENAVAVHATGSVDSNTAPQLQEPLLRAAENGAVQLPRRCKSAANACASLMSQRNIHRFKHSRVYFVHRHQLVIASRQRAA